MPIKTTEAVAEKWLKENASHFRILTWGGSGGSISKIYDSNRKKEFEYTFNKLKNFLVRDPLYLPCATKEEMVKRREDTHLKKYGFKNASQVKEFQDKRTETILERFGVENAFQSEEIKEKMKKANLEKYGVEYNLQRDETRGEWRTRGNQTRRENGSIRMIDGKSLSDWAKIKGCSVSTMGEMFNNYGDNFVVNYDKKYTSIEKVILDMVERQDVSILSHKKIGDYYYDFLIPDHDLIIECDGLYWHSDEVQEDKFYHQKKQKAYTDAGYDSLFFRGDEIRNKLPIVKSIILNRLGRSERIFARKCEIRNVSRVAAKEFLEANHLMSKGSGRSYGLYHENELVAMIQVKWRHLKDKHLEVSRFCLKLGTSVVGGLSRLLKHAERIEKPKRFVSFVDRRYGKGESMKLLGFTNSNEDLSFKWTQGGETFHRMSFPGNSGYENGFWKIWDCGQTKWEKHV